MSWVATFAADMRRQHNDTLRVITNRFAINLDILTIRVVSWDGASKAMALLATKTTQGGRSGTALP
jgi:hypothetical protein